MFSLPVVQYWLKGRKEIFYLMMHSIHSYFWLYDISHKVKDHIDNERVILLRLHNGLHFLKSSNGSFIYRIVHNIDVATPVVELCLE